MAEAANGARTYLVDLPPEALPPVRPRDLHAAWDNARGAALAQQWGRPLMLRFRRPGLAPDAPGTDLALADADACCWAAAVDMTVGLASPYGMSLCLRLLALVDLLPRAPWARPLVAINRDGAAIHPALLRAAAQTPLAPDARFDAAALHAILQLDAALPSPAAQPALLVSPAPPRSPHPPRSLRMTSMTRQSLLLGIVILATGLIAGCATPSSFPQPSAAQAAACRQRADEVHERQNRGDMFRDDAYAGGARDAMFSGTGSPGASIGMLSARFARDRLVDACLRGAAGNVASTPDAPIPTTTTAPAPARRPGS